MASRRPLPPLNPTRVFEVAGRSLNLSKAAEELSVTPAAVSRQVRALEDFLGLPLFRRLPGRLELTPAGARLLSDLVPIFAALRDAIEVARTGGVRANVLKIRSPATFAVRWLIPRLAGFHRLHGDIDVRLTTSSEPIQFDHADVDAGIQLGDGAWPRVRSQPLIPNVLVPVCAPTAVPDAGELAKARLLHSLARPDDWRRWLEAAGRSDVDADAGMKYETSLLAYQAAIEGHGVAIAQKALVDKELADGTLVAPFAFALDRGAHTYYFSWPAERPRSAALTVFVDWLSTIV